MVLNRKKNSMFISNGTGKKDFKSKEKKIEMRLFYERMNKNQRVTRVVYIIRVQLNASTTEEKRVLYADLYYICPFTLE